MTITRWSDTELREFVRIAVRLDYADEQLADLERARFRAQLAAFVAPAVRDRLLAEAGIPLSLDGIAMFGCDCIENHWGARREWLLLCVDPWTYLAEWIGDSAVASYRATVGKRRKQSKVLAGIAEASDRRAIEE